MNTFNEFVTYRDLMEDDQVPPGVDPEMWAAASPQMKKILMAQAAGQPYQASQGIQQQPVTYQANRAARALSPTGPIQGQTGQGLESVPAGGRVPSHLVGQIPPGDIAPSWFTATKFYKGRDGRVYKK